VCGITGRINFTGLPIEKTSIEAMTSALTHRGPDDFGLFLKHNTGLGHRRLKIIDPDGGSQPFISEDQQCAIVFNGVIYNYKELRHNLRKLGHIFKTDSDTEVLLHCWLEWKHKCVDELRGMFAFSIVDFHNRIVFLARDPFGIKPLYYELTSDSLTFASELQPLTLHKDYQLNYEILDEYLYFGFISAPNTIYKGIKKLLPGEHLSIALDGSRSTLTRYWSMRFQPELGRSTDSWLEELEYTIDESVKVHLQSDVPCGAFLSGGIDSTIVSALMKKNYEHSVRTYSIAFEQSELDESIYSRQAANTIGTDHSCAVDRSDPFQAVLNQLHHFGEPFADWSSVPTEHVSRMAKSEVTVVLSGDGGDELFAGYRHYETWMRDPGKDWHKTMLRCMDPEYRLKIWRNEYHNIILNQRTTTNCIQYAEDATNDRLSFAQACDLSNYLPNSVLHKVDIASMMHGLEVRTPFLDRSVADLVSRIPSSELAGFDNEGQWVGKRLLKKLLGRPNFPTFTDEFIGRRKQGFTPPVHHILTNNHDVYSLVKNTLTDKNSLIGDFVNPSGISFLFNDLFQGGGAEPIWALWVLENWLQITSGNSIKNA
jgi:asparagine synthase (glutamine-hydrolysing)